jgi:hypothetical protein
MSSEAVPRWSELPAYYQDDLKPWEPYLTEGDDILRLTVLTLYVKLKGLDLWRFVGTPENSTGGGRLEFLCTDINGLAKVLRGREDFSTPNLSKPEWASREWKGKGALHFKHFPGWEPAKLQAHIDKEGLTFNPLQLVLHAIDWLQDGYKDVYGNRRILLQQGWDPVPLVGVPPPEPRHDAVRSA